MITRHYSFLDRLVNHFDMALRTIATNNAPAQRSNPATSLPETVLTTAECRQSAALMRIDHVGEVCAQALYHGQSLTARSPHVREKMQQSSQEENDHLAWCHQRLNELNTHSSYLNPAWYLGSFFLGVIAGGLGDRWSLGFVAETEKQVVNHLENHLEKISAKDQKSRAILMQMREDESHHATSAIEIGAAELPEIIKQGMRFLSKVMTIIAYWI